MQMKNSLVEVSVEQNGMVTQDHGDPVLQGSTDSRLRGMVSKHCQTLDLNYVPF